MDVGRLKSVNRRRLKPLETGRLAERAKEALLASIRTGDFPNGHLPSEESLADELGVSRTTIREALRSLEEEGVVTRQHGVGTSINHHVLRTTSLNRIVGFYDLIREAGHRPEIAWTRVEHLPASPEVAERLAVAVGTPLLVLERLFLADDEPAVHLREHVPEVELERPVDAGSVPDSIFAFADAFCRAAIDHTIVAIVPTLASPGTAAHLGVEQGRPVLRLVETHYTADAHPIVASEIDTVDRFFRFTVVRKRL